MTSHSPNWLALGFTHGHGSPRLGSEPSELHVASSVTPRSYNEADISRIPLRTCYRVSRWYLPMIPADVSPPSHPAGRPSTSNSTHPHRDYRLHHQSGSYCDKPSFHRLSICVPSPSCPPTPLPSPRTSPPRAQSPPQSLHRMGTNVAPSVKSRCALTAQFHRAHFSSNFPIKLVKVPSERVVIKSGDRYRDDGDTMAKSGRIEVSYVHVSL